MQLCICDLCKQRIYSGYAVTVLKPQRRGMSDPTGCNLQCEPLIDPNIGSYDICAPCMERIRKELCTRESSEQSD